MKLQTIRVRDYMTRRLITLRPDQEILQALQAFVQNGIAGAPVVDDSGQLIGLLTEKDCMRVALNATYHSEYAGLVRDFMVEQVITIGPDEGIIQVAERFLSAKYHRYPVVEDGRLVGQISRRDVLRALGEAWH